MAKAPRPLVAGNWKMNGLRASVDELSKMVAAAAGLDSRADLLVCPPATLLSEFAARTQNSGIQIGAQDCHAKPSGAFTGDISAEMIADAGATAVITGHSERRTYHRESGEDVKAKAEAARRAGLVAIVCVGETQDEREAGATLARIQRQLEGSIPDKFDADNLVVAYEPVWAIGTGSTPTAADIAEVHQSIRNWLTERNAAAGPDVRILYGGSVKPSNASELLAIKHVNGALVGGASLKSEDFLGIATAYR